MLMVLRCWRGYVYDHDRYKKYDGDDKNFDEDDLVDDYCDDDDDDDADDDKWKILMMIYDRWW